MWILFHLFLQVEIASRKGDHIKAQSLEAERFTVSYSSVKGQVPLTH